MFVVGVSGVARSGKNLFCDLIIEELAKQGYIAKQFALANALKRDCENFLKNQCDLDVYTDNTQQKTLFREFLVWYGDLRRKQTNGRHWIETMDDTISRYTGDIALVSDVRYAHYANDELTWVTHEHEGLLVHLRRYEKSSSAVIEADGTVKFDYVKPPNEHERINDPKLREGAHFQLDWPTVEDPRKSLEIMNMVNEVTTEIIELVNK
jgi:predicted DNA-binding protein YlxM (UPF0122 family)